MTAIIDIKAWRVTPIKAGLYSVQRTEMVTVPQHIEFCQSEDRTNAEWIAEQLNRSEEVFGA